MSQPKDIPPPYAVANHCAIYAWRQDCQSDVRCLFEMAADSLREQYRQRLRHASRVEQLEAEIALLRSVAFGPQKGGAA